MNLLSLRITDPMGAHLVLLVCSTVILLLISLQTSSSPPVPEGLEILPGQLTRN